MFTAPGRIGLANQPYQPYANNRGIKQIGQTFAKKVQKGLSKSNLLANGLTDGSLTN